MPPVGGKRQGRPASVTRVPPLGGKRSAPTRLGGPVPGRGRLASGDQEVAGASRSELELMQRRGLDANLSQVGPPSRFSSAFPSCCSSGPGGCLGQRLTNRDRMVCQCEEHLINRCGVTDGAGGGFVPESERVAGRIRD